MWEMFICGVTCSGTATLGPRMPFGSLRVESAVLARLSVQSTLETSFALPALAGWFVLVSRRARGFPREFLPKMALGKETLVLDGKLVLTYLARYVFCRALALQQLALTWTSERSTALLMRDVCLGMIFVFSAAKHQLRRVNAMVRKAAPNVSKSFLAAQWLVHPSSRTLELLASISHVQSPAM